MCPFKMAKVFNIMPKWRNFAKFGRTDLVGLNVKRVQK